jgi:hypothetical protein
MLMERVSAKFPLPEGYRDIQAEDSGTVYDRTNMSTVTIVAWNIDRRRFSYCLAQGYRVEESSAWFVKPA